jgi:regulator of ribonuclease activity A
MYVTCDLCDEHGEALGVLPSGLVHFGGRARFHGPAETVKTFEVNSRVRELAHEPGNGRVMVVDGGGSDRRALLGDVLAGAALSNGWAGVVIWGAVRDIAELAKLDLGVMALARTPARCDRKGDGETGIPVTIGGVRISPGDMIVADEDGVIVAPPGLIGG